MTVGYGSQYFSELKAKPYASVTARHQQHLAGKCIWCNLAAFVLTALATPGSTAAEEQVTAAPTSAPLRALVWLQPDADDVLTRVRGQANDLRVELLVDDLDS